MSKNVLTPRFRASYPNLFRPRLNELNGKEEYSVVALFPKNADLSKLKAACQEAIAEKWGKDRAKWPKNLRLPFRDQKERAKEDEDGGFTMPDGYEEGAVFMTLRSARPPGVVDQRVQKIIEETEIYGGCYLQASVNFYAYDMKGNKGVGCGLVNVQKVADGKPIGGSIRRPEDDFVPIATDESNAANMTASDMFL